jgi:hypothetical protein
MIRRRALAESDGPPRTRGSSQQRCTTRLSNPPARRDGVHTFGRWKAFPAAQTRCRLKVVELLHFFRRYLVSGLLCAACLTGAELPVGTELSIRLKSKVSSQTSRAGDPVEAVVIGGPIGGAVVRGAVEKVTQSTKGDERSLLVLRFDEVEAAGTKRKLAALVAAVENAREQVDDQGQIQGILTSETITGKIDAGLGKLAEKSAGFAGLLGAVKGAVFKAAEGDITYDSGVEMTLRLTAPLDAPPVAGPKLEPVAEPVALATLVEREPFQTVAQNPPKPSDITNLLLVGTEEQIRQAFTDAGWHTAAELSTVAKLETLRAVAENRGYNEAPVSILLLEGKPPDMVFQKVTNTFARRHHLRIWRRPVTFDGRPVWAVAATHDIGISFSEQNRTFIHQIDSQIDRERTKVVDDLVFTGRVQSVQLVERPKVPTKSENATGDALQTDAKIAVIVFAK